MTISIETTRNRYSCSGGTVYAYGFKIWAEGDLVVIRGDASGVESVLTLNTDYTVSGVGVATGGNVTTTATYTDGSLTIMRADALTQETNLVPGATLPVKTIEDTDDKIVSYIQQVNEKLNRAALLKRSTPTTGAITLPEPAANNLLRWDSAGTNLENYDSTATVTVPQIDYIGNYSNNLATALTAIGASDTTLIINTNVTLDASSTVPSNVQLWFLREGKITLGNYNLTINGSVEAGLWKIFDYTGTGVVTFGSGIVINVFPQWFGASPSSTAATNSTGMQNFINCIAGSHRATGRIPDGKYEFDSTLYFYYDAANNPNYPSDAEYQGTYTFVGEGAGGVTNFTQNKPVGTVLKYTSGTGNGLELGNSLWTGGTRTIRITDIAIWGATTGNLVDAVHIPQMSTIERLFIGNDAAGTAFYLVDAWMSKFADIYLLGNDTTPAGTGFNYDVGSGAGPNAGGLNRFENITASGFSNPIILGSDYDAANQLHKASTFVNIQGRNGTIGIHVKHGIDGAVFINHWTEGNTTAGLQISDSANNIKFIGGSHGDSDAGLTADVILGRSAGTTDEVGTKNIRFIGTRFDQVNTIGIRRYVSSVTKNLILDGCIFDNNGGTPIVIDDVDQNGFTLKNIDWDGNGTPFAVGAQIHDGSGNDMDHRVNHTEQYVNDVAGAGGGAGSPDLDLSGESTIPRYIFFQTISASAYMKLPTQAEPGTKCTFIKSSTNNTATIDAGTGTISGNSTVILSDTYQSVTIVARVYSAGTQKWDIIATNHIVKNAYTPTNVTTDRAYDANATTTSELADVLGTLIADLQTQGILK